MNPILERLRKIHRKLDGEIRRERKQRLPDTHRLTRLKKLKLAIKDRLQRHLAQPRRA